MAAGDVAAPGGQPLQQGGAPSASVPVGLDAPPDFHLATRLQGQGALLPVLAQRVQPPAPVWADNAAASSSVRCGEACQGMLRSTKALWSIAKSWSGGAGNSFFDHIASQSSATLQLRGRGAGVPGERWQSVPECQLHDAPKHH